MTYQETLDYMFTQLPMYQRTGKAAYKANLDNTIALDEYFEHPHKKFKTIHVAGTNGKGSVSHSIASVLQNSGLKVGLYTSPHLRDFRERIKINGKMISESTVVDFIADHKLKFEEVKPSFFEMTVALAFHYFAIKEVDIAIIEVGLGGRLDSTNIINPLASIITNISKDHTNLLGNQLTDIAAEKAGIIKNNTPVIIGEKQESIAEVFIEKSKAKNSKIFFAEDRYQFSNAVVKSGKQEISYIDNRSGKILTVDCDLLGGYQLKNIRTVLCACEILKNQGIRISDENIKNGLASVVQSTGLLGRWQILESKPQIICDTGHNIAGIKEIIEQINKTEYGNLHLVFGMVNDKSINEILSLLPKSAIYYFTKANIPRALDEKVLQNQAKAFGLVGNVYSTVKEAYGNAKKMANENDLIYVGGSTFVVAEVI